MPTPLTYARAKRMRREPTEAERRLWGGLRNRALCGYKFHRQVPIGPFIVDFLNRENHVVIEVDGPTHGNDGSLASDARRSAYLSAIGFAVYRVGNNDIYRNISDVLDGIALFVAEQERKMRN